MALSINHLIVGAYFAILFLLMVYCIHRYCILYLYFKHKKHNAPTPPLPAALPRINVQLPIYN